MSILSGAIGTMKKKGSALPLWYQVPGTYNSKTYWVTGLSSEPNAGTSGLLWKTTNTSTAGTTSLTDGLTNSNNMNTASHPAAYYCRGLTLGGYSWFLPAKNELVHIYTNLSASGKLLDPAGTHVDKFTGTYYWSSTEFDIINAWFTKMNGGYTSGNSKANSTFRVRACRKV